MDIDRLGRGDMGDQDKIKKVFAQSNTLVVTEKEVYNLNNDDEFIVKRLVRGKKVGSRMGMWTNGKPPFPYEYETYKDKYLEKGIVVNDEKLIVHRFIIDSIYKGMSVHEISHKLNRQRIPSPGGRDWVGITISRIAKDETQLGRIISNKTSGDTHKSKKPNSKS